MRKPFDLKISVSGIRGKIGRSFTPGLVISFSEAFATYLGGGKIAVATDTRPTRELVKHAVFAGLLSCGAVPVDAGILPIPSFQIYVRDTRARGGIAITASHNPVEWNALKLVKRGGFFPFSYQTEEILDIYHQGKFKRYTYFTEKPKIDRDAFRFHKNRLLSFANIELIKNKRPKVVVDACNGASSPYIENFLKSLGCEVIAINNDINSPFPHSPEPLPENLTQLCEAVKKYGADIGFAQDADADRLAAVDERGTPIGEEYTLALAVKYYLENREKSPVVVNLSTSRAVEDVVKEEGVPFFRSKVGEINVVEEMIKRKSKIGGEGNGGIISADVHLCRDSFAGMVLLLELLSKSGKRLSELVSEIPRYFMIKDKIEVSLKDSIKIVEYFKKIHKNGRINLLDGIRIDYNDYWVHIRPSNTEPVLRIIVEARTKTMVNEVYEKVKKQILELKEV